MTNLRVILTLTTACLTGACGQTQEARSAGSPCVLSEDCSSNLCYESRCLDPASDDDGDGLTNATEAKLGTMATRADSDGDGASDAEEVGASLEAPLNGDGDALIDALESFLVTSEHDNDCVAPQYDREDATDNSAEFAQALTCCCDEACDKVGVTVLDYVCEAGVPRCSFSPSDDLDGDGFLNTCDSDDDGDGVADGEDCAPEDPLLTQANDEQCDGIDNDCDGQIDEALATLSCGLGACQKEVPSCVEGSPQSCAADAGASEELCDGSDNDCDGQIDESLDTLTCGIGQCEKSVPSCVEGVAMACDPDEGASDESCDGIDNDCDGQIDEAWDDLLGLPCLTAHEDCGGVVYFECSADDDGVLCPQSAAPAGTPCDDGNPKSEADQCDAAGNCTGVVCNAGEGCTTYEVIDGACVYTALAGSCFIDGTCHEAGSSHAQFPCKTCDPETASESWTYLSEGAPCDDGNSCSQQDQCTSEAVCLGVPLVCDDGHACTTDSCQPATGCVHEPKAEACDDGIPCTLDTCSTSEGCVQTPDDALCDEGDPCWSNSCDVGAGCQATWLALDTCLYECAIFDVEVGKSSAADGGTTGHAAFAGDYVYVVQQTSGAKELNVIDASDNANPQPLTLFSQVSMTWGEGTDLLNVSLPRRVLITEPQGPLYIASSGGFHVVDVSAPETPEVLANHAGTLGQLYGMVHHPSEPVVYGAIESGALIAIALATPSQPASQIHEAQLSVETFDVSVGPGNRLYLAGYDLSLQSFDILDPLNPVNVSALSGVDSPTNLAESTVEVHGSLAVVASNRDGYRIVDVSKQNTMELLYESGSPSKVYDVAFFEGYLLLASKDQGLVIVDIAVPTAPEEVAQIAIGGTPRGVHLVGHRVFVSTSSHFLQVIDLTLPCSDDDPCTLDGCHVEEGCIFNVESPCDDLDPCTSDSCSPGEGCQHVVLPNCVLGGVGAP